MKIAVIIVRVLLGLLFLFASVSFFLDLIPVPEMEGDILAFNTGLAASKYFFPLLKTTELLCGLALVIGFFVPLATIVLIPITVNILMVHLFLDPTGLPMAIVMIVAHLFLIYACRAHYRRLLSPRIEFSNQSRLSQSSRAAAANENRT